MGRVMGDVAKNKLFAMEIDEVSLVDRPANQHASVLISKADTPEEEAMGYVDADGNPIDESALEHGDVVYGDNGDPFVFVEEGREADFEVEDFEDTDTDDREPALVGKSFGAEVLEAISKAVDDDDQKEAIAKAFAVQQEQIEEFRKRAEMAEAWAEQEHDQRVTEAFIAKAEEFNLPVSAEVFGPILKKMATVLDDSELDIVEKVFTEAGDMLYDEVGYVGTASNGPLDEVEAVAKAAVSKAASGGTQISEDDALIAALEMNPEAYAAYNAEYMGR